MFFRSSSNLSPVINLWKFTVCFLLTLMCNLLLGVMRFSSWVLTHEIVVHCVSRVEPVCLPEHVCLCASAFLIYFQFSEKKTIIDSNWFAFKRCVTNVFLFLPLLRKLHKTSTSKLIFDIRPKLPALHISWRRQSIFK